MRAEVDVRPVREPRRARPTRGKTRTVRRGRLALWLGVLLVLGLLVVGLAFAGSGDRLAAGIRVADVHVSGLTPAEAERKLAGRAAPLASVPVTFVAGDRRFKLAPERLDLEVDWGATLAKARSAGAWPLPFRGLKRIAVRLFGADVDPVAGVYDAGLAYEVNRIAGGLDRPARSAAVVLDGLRPRIIGSQPGARLENAAARKTIVAALAGFSRKPVELPVLTADPPVTTAELEPVLAQVRTALARPVRFGWDGGHWRVQPREVAKLLQLPADGRTKLEIGGAYATTYFSRLARAVEHRPKNATFAVTGKRSVRVVPARDGLALDATATAKALLAAALATGRRDAELVVREQQASFTTEEAKALGVTREIARYSTFYAGDADRITNLTRAVKLLNDTRIGPGTTFSFNGVVGRRTEGRGFRPAPVIVGGEYEVGVGGGVSQVATTVFNAAWEAGLKITDRTAHALYISRYPPGRDATVNYPDIDLKFENDTGGWLVMQASPTTTGIAIALLGKPTGRRVVSQAGELEEIAPPRVKRVPDPGLFVGETVVEASGVPAQSITVERIVYQHGEVLYDETWRTTYQSEPKIVRFGTIPIPVVEEPAAPAEPQGETQTASTTTTEATPTTTGQTGTTQTGTGETGTGQTTTGRG